MKAIDLNGAAIEMNKLAFSWGRLAAHDLQRVDHRRALQERAARRLQSRRSTRAIAFRANFLTELSGRSLLETLSRRCRARPRRGSQGRRPARTN